MSVTGVSNYSSTLKLSELYATLATNSATSSTSTNSVSTSSCAANKADTLDISKPAELYSKLQQLAESDPEKLKEVCSSIAEKLNTAAESSDDPMLSDLAEKFQNVADGGDVSQLKPPPPPGGGGKPNGIEQYSKQQDSKLVDFLSSSQSGNKTDADELLSSILEEVNSALAS